jgi:cation:H+ antiporter
VCIAVGPDGHPGGVSSSSGEYRQVAAVRRTLGRRSTGEARPLPYDAAPLWLPLLLLTLSLVLLTVGAEVLVRGSSALAMRAGVSAFFVGMTVVGFGTSTPELATSVFAALDGAPEISIGNVVGSNIANLLLVLGAVALLRPVPVMAKSLNAEILLLAGVTALPWLALATGSVIPRWMGMLFVIGLVAFIGWSYRASRDEPPAVQAEAPTLPEGWRGGWTVNILLTVVGIAILVGSSRLLVDSAVELAELWSVPPLVIGLTVVAFGTSAPELVTSLVASWRGKDDLGLGNLIGSGIFNVLGILGLTAIVVPVPIEPQVFRFDLVVATMAPLLVLPLARSGRVISRTEGGLLFGAFVLYTVALYAGWPQSLLGG